MSVLVSDAPAPSLARRPPVGWLAAARLGLAILAVLLALALRLPELERYATIDESRWVSRAADFAAYLQQGDPEETYLVGHPGVTTMWLGALGLGPERVQAFSFLAGQTDVTRRDGYLEALVAARRAAVLANAVALGGLAWLAWGVFGPGPAVLGTVLLLLDPFLTAHSRLIHLDALLSSFMALAALSWVAFWRGGSWGYAGLAGLAGGLALLTKAPSVYLLAFTPGVALLATLRAGRGRTARAWWRLAGGLALWAGLAAAVCLALWPALRERPVRVLREMIEFTLKNGGGERDNYFLGQPVADPGLPFYPLALLFRATPLMLLGIGLLVAMLAQRRRLAARWPALLLGGYVIGFMAMMSLGEKKFDRYELPIFPVLDVLAGLGLWLGWQAARARLAWLRRGPARLGLGLALLGVAAWPLASVYPYDLAYYNPLVGGGPAARWALFVGWGEGLDQVAAYVNAKPIVLQAPTVATPYHRALQAHLRGNNALPIERAELADYIVPYVNSMQRQQNGALLNELLQGQEPEYVVWLNGIEYARVYRGPHLPVERPLGIVFGERLRLESLVFAPGSGRARAGDDLLFRLRWRPLGELVTATAGRQLDLGVTVDVADANGRPVASGREPLGRALQENGLLVLDGQLTLPRTLAPGDYQLRVAVADAGGRPLAPTAGPAPVPVQTITVQPAVAR